MEAGIAATVVENQACIPSYYKERLWKALAPFYDLLFKLVFVPLGGHGQVRKGLVDFAGVRPGDSVLDIGCGTGDLTALLAKRVGAQGSVVGVDLSDAMIAQARRKARLSWLRFFKANMEQLPFRDGAFDKAFMSFSLHEIPANARLTALRQAARVLRPEGGLFLLEYRMPDGPLSQRVVSGFMRLVEEEDARRMVRERRLVPELEQAGFIIRKCCSRLHGAVIMVQASKKEE